MMRNVKRFLIATTMLVGTVVGITASNPAVAGAQSIQPCFGGSNGWFETNPPPGQPGGFSAINCSIQGNHIVVDLWNGGTRSQGVVDMWHDTGVAPSFGVENGTFRIKFNTVTSPALVRPWHNMNEMPAPTTGWNGSYAYADMIKTMGVYSDSYVRTHQGRVVNWDSISGVLTWDHPSNPFGFTDVWPRGVNNNPYFRAGVKLDDHMVDYPWYEVVTAKTWVWRAT